jgi:hypothetical protein
MGLLGLALSPDYTVLSYQSPGSRPNKDMNQVPVKVSSRESPLSSRPCIMGPEMVLKTDICFSEAYLCP